MGVGTRGEGWWFYSIRGGQGSLGVDAGAARGPVRKMWGSGGRPRCLLALGGGVDCPRRGVGVL